MSMKKSILLGLTVVLFVFEVSAQTVSPRAPILLNLDFSRFRYDDQSCYLEIYYGFHPQQVTFHYTDARYQGGVLLSTKIKKNGTNEIIVDEKSPLEISEADTGQAWYHGPLISQAGYAVPHGEYVMEVIASDLKEPSRRDSISLDLIITPYGSDLAVSDIELCKNITRSDQKDNLYYKNALVVIPYPSLVYGSATNPVMYCYAELYNVKPGVTYTVKTEILDANGTSVREQERQTEFISNNSIEVGTIPVTSFLSGKYQYRLTLLDDNRNEVIQNDKEFFILNPHLSTPQPTAGLSKAIFTSLSGEELVEEFEFARYVARDQEKRMFKELVTTQAKGEFMFDFWGKVARGRADLPPIMRREYLERVEIANQRYSAFRKKGWEADRGRVFIVYSEPDQVERVPSEPNAKPYEVWYYFEIEGGAEFYFVDRRGFGELELVHSTKRGELYDEGWERWLR